jgi:hypothetical protein
MHNMLRLLNFENLLELLLQLITFVKNNSDTTIKLE